jgi:IclR family transcriptional regulator, pca regulon regulatory protein
MRATRKLRRVGERDATQDAGTQHRAAARPAYVQSLERGLAVIRALSAPGAGLTLAEVARAAGLDRAAGRRFLHTLVGLGYVRNNGREFSLTPKVLELGYAYLASLTLPDIVQPHIERLVEEQHESSSVSVLHGPDIVYIARVPIKRIMRVAVFVGTHFPAYATSMGRVLLAALEPEQCERLVDAIELAPLASRTITDRDVLLAEIASVRERGWAMVDEELEDGLRSVAVPIRDRTGRTVAAVNMSCQTGRTSLEEVEDRLLPALLIAAGRIEWDLRNTRIDVGS